MIAFLRVLLNSAVAWTYLAALLRVGAAIFILPVILRVLPSEQLGLWYLFVSLGSLASLLDLGFSLTATRAVAYLWAGAPRLLPFGFAQAPADPAAGPVVDRDYLRRLISTLRLYYLAMGGLALLLLTVGGGAWIWHKTAAIDDATQIRAAWLVYALAGAFTLNGALWPSLCSGVNQVQRSQRILVGGLLVYYVSVGMGLALGMGLLALAAANLAGSLAGWTFGWWMSRKLLPEMPSLTRSTVDWEILRILWPNAWRTAAVSVGAYLILQANTVICSAVLGLEVTGSYGLSFQVAGMLSALSGVWVQVKLPLINQWRAQGRSREVARLFAQRVQLAVLTFAVGAAGFVALGPWLLELVHSRTTLLPRPLLALQLTILLLEMHHSLYASLVYTENYNPFLKPALISGVCIVGLSFWLSHPLGLWGMLLATGVVQACYNNWWPVWRAIHGLGLVRGEYWRIFRVAYSR